MKFLKLLQNKIFSAVLISLIITAISAALIIPDIFHGAHLKIADTLYTRNEPSQDIVIIGVDDKSTDSKPPGLGRFSLWGRENYAKLLEVLRNENPKVIVFDILFHTYSTGITGQKLGTLQYGGEENLKTAIADYFSVVNHPSDTFFADELEKTDNVILMGKIAEEEAVKTFPIPKFMKGNPTIGITEVSLDEDGILRKVQTEFSNKNGDETYDNIALAAVKKYLDGNVSTQKIRNLPMENKEMNVNFFGNPFSFQIISFVDVLNKNYGPDTFKNKIVLIGVTTLKEGQDRFLTPRSNKVPMPGIEFIANTIQTILEGKFLQDQGKGSLILYILGGTLSLALLFNYAGIIVSTVMAVLALLGYYFAAHLMYKNGFIPNMVYPFLAIALSYIAALAYRYFVADKNKREISSAFGHYVSEDLVAEISKNPDMVKLGGEKKIITVFFSDLKNSTALSEKTEISSWVEQINEYFTVMEKVVKHFGGTIDKYEGDAIMGFWNAPISEKDHVLRAYLAAIEMKKYLKVLNVKWEKENKSILDMRIGINTGEAIVGNFGSTGRFDYTAMGDTVNTASRLESCASKTYGGATIVAGFEKYQDLKELNEKVVLREVDTATLPGKKDPIKIYELVC